MFDKSQKSLCSDEIIFQGKAIATSSLFNDSRNPNYFWSTFFTSKFILLFFAIDRQFSGDSYMLIVFSESISWINRLKIYTIKRKSIKKGLAIWLFLYFQVGTSGPNLKV